MCRPRHTFPSQIPAILVGICTFGVIGMFFLLAFLFATPALAMDLNGGEDSVVPDVPPVSSPAPSLVALPTSVSYGGKPVLKWIGVVGNLSCDVSSTNGDVWFGTGPFTANAVFTDTVQYYGYCYDDAANSFSSTVTVTRSNLPAPTLSAVDSSVPYGGRPTLQWSGVPEGVVCNVSSSNGDTWYGNAPYSANALHADTVQFYGYCYDDAGNSFSSFATVTRSSLPSPALAANAPSVPYGGTPVLTWSGLVPTLSCNVSSSNGDAHSGNAPFTANALYAERVNFNGYCYDEAGNSFSSFASVTRSSVPSPVLTATPATVAYGGKPVLQWTGADGLSCYGSSSNGDSWFGAAPFTAAPLQADGQYDGYCYDGAGNDFTSSITVTVGGGDGDSCPTGSELGPPADTSPEVTVSDNGALSEEGEW